MNLQEIIKQEVIKQVRKRIQGFIEARIDYYQESIEQEIDSTFQELIDPEPTGLGNVLKP